MSRRRRPGDGNHAGATATGRGVGLLIVAVVVGVLVLHSLSRTSTAPTTQEAATTATTAGSSGGGHSTTTTLPTRPPSQVVTLVANGTRVSGAAGRVNTVLQKAGYNVLSPTNAASTVTASVVYFASGFDREAVALANSLSLGPSTVQPMPAPPPVSDLRGANVLVVVGPDLANQTGSSSPSSSTTTTAG